MLVVIELPSLTTCSRIGSTVLRGTSSNAETLFLLSSQAMSSKYLTPSNENKFLIPKLKLLSITINLCS